MDVGAVDVAADLAHQRHGVEIQPAGAGGIEQLQAVEQRAAGAGPVAGALVAAAVVVIDVQEAVQAAQDFVHGCRRAAVRLSSSSAQVSQLELIQGFQLLTSRLPGPSPIHQKSSRVRFGVEDAAVDLGADARAHQRTHGVELRAQQVVGPRQQSGRLGGEQIHDRFGGIRQAGTRLLRAQVRRNAPEGLLAGGPDAVHDVVEETSLALDALGDDQFPQLVRAGRSAGPGSGTGCRCARIRESTVAGSSGQAVRKLRSPSVTSEARASRGSDSHRERSAAVGKGFHSARARSVRGRLSGEAPLERIARDARSAAGVLGTPARSAAVLTN